MADQPLAVVSGGTGALGSVIVARLLGRGYRVAVPFRRRGESAAETPHDSRALYAEADITSGSGVAAFFDEISRVLGPPFALVNAAGGYAGGVTVDAMTIEAWDAMLTANLRTAFLMSRAAVGMMKPRGAGRIISIAAKTGLEPESGKAAYAVAKRGVITLTETMALEARGSGITVNAIAPGIILTEANRAWMSPEMVKKAVPPDDLAAIVLFLCSEEGRAVNGTTVRCYGGL
jgi:NAD(P)-dependent dehydrogenase (short-subunit alcohol dehydrogenase family)